MNNVSDASVFELFPIGAHYPLDSVELSQLVSQASKTKIPLTLRAGGTSLGGQAIGEGVILDVSKHLTNILDYDADNRRITVEPGVIQDDLNDFVRSDGLRFAPDTSTSNRAMIGGMIGNNSCGAYSVYYGTTREHVISLDVVLADGSDATFEPLSPDLLSEKCALQTLEGHIYRRVMALLETHGDAILQAFPHPSIKRRNTGYALDELYRHHQPFNPAGKPFSLVPLLCGSEGTLAVTKAATLNLVPLPKHRQLICAHYDSVQSALECVPELLNFQPAAVEIIDKATLDGTLNNREQTQNRVWIEGDPQAVLVIEFFPENIEELERLLKNSQAWLLENKAYSAPVIPIENSHKVWNLRKAGLGVLMGKITRKKAVAVVEDAAVPVVDLPNYYRDVQALMTELGVGCVYYGHASVGLIHVRPELDLATPEGQQLFQTIGQRMSTLVKTYRGALSGEHGDGRIRAPFLKEQFGDEVYQHLVELKRVFDPEGLLNPGVIIGEMPITEHLRANRQPKKKLNTGFDWSNDLSLFDAVEKCNGAGACRKSAGRGTMCPSYQATREEQYSTRGRSNLLRFALTEPNPQSALKADELQDALEMCLGCKACHTECPASVDMAKLKSEVLYQVNHRTLSKWLIAHYGTLLALGAKVPRLFNAFQNVAFFKKALSVDSRRSLPKLAHLSLSQWWGAQKSRATESKESHSRPNVWVLCDLFSQYQEPQVGQAVLNVFQTVGCNVRPVFLKHSPRALISQGLVDEARQALLEIQTQLTQLTPGDWVVGIEPSELLVWRDEAERLLPEGARNYQAWQILLFEEAILKYAQQHSLELMPLKKTIKVHTHCHQKALANESDVITVLQKIPHAIVERIHSGCCGMSGEFGYRHYEVSKTIAEQAILPVARNLGDEEIMVATGTSCRHQVQDLAGKQSVHVAEILAPLIVPLKP